MKLEINGGMKMHAERVDVTRPAHLYDDSGEVDGEITLKITDEGVIVDVVGLKSGEILRTALFSWDWFFDQTVDN